MIRPQRLSELRDLLPEQQFLRALCLERKRTERSRNPFVLMLLSVATSTKKSIGEEPMLDRIVPTILRSVRETDIVGWHKDYATLGVIFAELGLANKESVLGALRERVATGLRSVLRTEEVNRINITFYCFPEDWKAEETSDNGHSHTVGRRRTIAPLYPDLAQRDDGKNISRVVKRGMDIVGSCLALLALLPVILIIALAVKLTSPGPIMFRQKRIGQYGVPFTFLKFRTMYTANDPQIHKEYVTRFIAGHIKPAGSETNGKAVYKITKDPRLTRVGGFLRRTSLDELPQFVNVLRGEMSLVGPRPPVLYEVDAYDVWHRRRVLEVKPGITGLWQVSGRSRLRFDDMVRLDLRYAKAWSLWLDLKILVRTPRAVLSGEGAY
jgi:lipopolysaccharide/colanic/teichoic acid biosynthesis glycosyltransferase